MNQVAFICYPSLGLLDSWISVFFLLQESSPQTEFIFISPQARTIGEIDLESTIIRLSSDIFTQVIFRSENGKWYQTESFRHAMEVELRTRNNVIEKVLLKFLGYPGPDWTTRKQKATYEPNLLVPESLHQASAVVCLDLFETHKKPMMPLLPFIRSNPKASLFHGINAPHTGACSYRENSYSHEIFHNTIIFAQGKSEEECYLNHLSAPPQSVEIAGIPRHDSKWIKTLNRREKNPRPQRNFIYILSRPSTTHYITRQQKKAYLYSIREAAEQYNLDIVIKMHPKEHDDHTFQKVFQKKKFGVSWWFSNRHPLTMKNGCVAAVTFHSGTSVDMARIGVPVIEYLNPKNVSTDDRVFKYRRAGWVLPASNHEEFLVQFNRVFHHRDKTLAPIQKKIGREFPQKKNPNNVIANRILPYLLQK